jgi:chemotaxis receptor (MCP) glutamine deamidase CheD
MTEDSGSLPVAAAGGADHIHRDDLRKEGWTMALYVAICLIAALTALETVTAVPGHIMGLVWGTTVGLALAHVFAFRVAGRLVHEGELPKADRAVSMVQLASAAAVAVVVSVPVLLAPVATELDWARYTCAAIIGLVGYMVARGAARGRIRAVLFGLAVLAAAIAVAALKHALAGH